MYLKVLTAIKYLGIYFVIGCFKSTIERFSGLDIVINNAGIGNEKETGWRKVVDINLVSLK